MFRLPSISSLDQVIDAALRVDGAQGGIVFHHCGPDEALVIASHRGVHDSLFLYEAEIRPGDGSATGEAVVQRHRVVIRDLAADPIEGSHRDVAERASIRAIVATPLIGAGHRMLGALTLFYSAPHHPTPQSLELLDTCAEIAVRLIEIDRLGEETEQADHKMGIPQRALSPAAAQAADAARALLPMLGRTEHVDGAMLTITARHLALVADELEGNLKRHRGSTYSR